MMLEGVYLYLISQELVAVLYIPNGDRAIKARDHMYYGCVYF